MAATAGAAGTVALGGTKIPAYASIDANRGQEWLEKIIRYASVSNASCSIPEGPPARQRDPAWQQRYRTDRPVVERKVSHFTRRAWGGRKARTRGLARVTTDLVTRAGAINWARLAALGLDTARQAGRCRPRERSENGSPPANGHHATAMPSPAIPSRPNLPHRSRTLLRSWRPRHLKPLTSARS